MFNHILIPTDGSELAGKAVDQGLALAGRLGAKVTFLTVVEPFHVLTMSPDMLNESIATYETYARDHALAVLGRCEEAAKAAGVASRSIRQSHDHPHEAIIAVAASEGCDLIAMSSHGRRGFAAAVLGSQTMKVLTSTTTPVLVFR